MDLINAECRNKDVRVLHADGTPGKVLRITVNLIRKMISTEAYGHDAATNTDVVACLQHSEETTARHYVVGTAQKVVRQQQTVRSVENSGRLRGSTSSNSE